MPLDGIDLTVPLGPPYAPQPAAAAMEALPHAPAGAAAAFALVPIGNLGGLLHGQQVKLGATASDILLREAMEGQRGVLVGQWHQQQQWAAAAGGGESAERQLRLARHSFGRSKEAPH